MGLLDWFKPKPTKPKKHRSRRIVKKPIVVLPLVNQPMSSREASEAVKKIAEAITKKRPPCPDKHKLLQICACITCPQLGSCAVEKSCRTTGCETVISICSRKAVLDKGEGAVSDFGEYQSHVSMHRVVTKLVAEEKNPKKSVIDENTKEKINGKEKAEGITDGEFPTVRG